MQILHLVEVVPATFALFAPFRFRMQFISDSECCHQGTDLKPFIGCDEHDMFLHPYLAHDVHFS
jgi:hypothetical protein